MVLRKFTRSGKKLNVHPLLTSFLLIVIIQIIKKPSFAGFPEKFSNFAFD